MKTEKMVVVATTLMKTFTELCGEVSNEDKAEAELFARRLAETEVCYGAPNALHAREYFEGVLWRRGRGEVVGDVVDVMHWIQLDRLRQVKRETPEAEWARIKPLPGHFMGVA